MCGIIVQLPLPAHIDTNAVLDAINPDLDVDCLGRYNNDHFYNDTGRVSYPTALACIQLLDSVVSNFDDKNIVVLGQGKLVGRPVTHLLEKRGLNVSVVDSRTMNAKDLIKNADVLISAIGQGRFIVGEMLKEGVVVIDAGTSEENGSVVVS